jgi:hypothetical protein
VLRVVADAAKAERLKRARDRLTLRVLIEDWNQMHLAGPGELSAEAVRALHYIFADALDDAAEELKGRPWCAPWPL